MLHCHCFHLIWFALILKLLNKLAYSDLLNLLSNDEEFESCYCVKPVARPAKAIREMWNKALSWPPLPSLLFFSIFSPSRPHVLALSLSAVRVCVCVCGELWGKGRASEREQLSFAVSQCISNAAPRFVSLCVSCERRGEGEGRREE